MNSRIKLFARTALNGSYFEIIPILTVIIFLRLLFSLARILFSAFYPHSDAITIIFYVVLFAVAVIVISPMRLQLEIKHLSLAKRCKNAERIGLKYALKSCGMSLMLLVFKAFWFAVFEFLPAISAAIFILCISTQPLSMRAAKVILAGIVLVAAMGLFFYFSAIQRYSMAMFYLACYKDFSVLDAIKESISKTKGKRRKTLMFKVSFLPWFLLCLGIAPAFFVVPYYKQSITCHFLYDW